MTEPVTPMLGDVELRAVQQIATAERRALVEHRVPGMAGNVFQDLGRSAARVALRGVLFSDTARDDLEGLRQRFHAGEPLSFTADITTATQIVDVLIEELRVVEVAGRPGTFTYDLVLRESPPPPPQEPALGGVDAGILGDAQASFGQALALADVVTSLGDTPDFGDPTAPLSGLLDRFAKVTEALPGLLTSLTDEVGAP
jgi:hypothetical protein